jgi:hypothetical protein
MTPQGTGAEPLSPAPPIPAPPAPEIINKRRWITRTRSDLWAVLLAATGQISWPSAGRFHGRHWANPNDH